MTDSSTLTLMIFVAVATPLLALLTFVMGWLKVILPLSAARLWLMAAVGPVNLALWLGFRGYLEQVGNRSLIGIGLAVAVVAGGSLLSGAIRGRAEGRRHGGGEGAGDEAGEAGEAGVEPAREDRPSSRWFRPER